MLRGPRSLFGMVAALALFVGTTVSCGVFVSFDQYDTASPSALYAVGGTIDGLAGGTATIRLNGQNPQSVVEGTFSFRAAVRDRTPYAVDVVPPSGLVCSPTVSSGTVAGADVTDIAIHCQVSSDANLTSLSLSVGVDANVELSPPFDPAHSTYTLDPIRVSAVLPPATTTTVTAIAADSVASIEINGEATKSATPSAPRPLRDGSTPIEIVVTAADRLTKKKYTVAVVGRPSDYLKASNTRTRAAFGTAVALSEDTLVVGATSDSTFSKGVNGDQANASARGSGAAYVFTRTGTGVAATWMQTSFIKASNTLFKPTATNTPHDASFGQSLALSGNTLVVGAPGESSGATGVAGNQDDTSAEGAGAVYVFVRTGPGAAWSQQAYIKASNTQSGADPILTNAHFGSSVALSGETLVVGAPAESGGASGVNGDQTVTGSRTGAVYVFTRQGALWSQQSYIKASNPNPDDGQAFGGAVALLGDTLAVGASGEASGATGVNANQADRSTPGAGAVYVFTRTGAAWAQQAYVKPASTRPRAYFGSCLALSGDTLAVGAVGESDFTGAAHVFTRTGAGAGASWSQQSTLRASNARPHANFGVSIALSGDALIVGSNREAGATSGVNGDQTDTSAMNAGAAYAFLRTGAAWSQQAYVKASNTRANANFGDSVALAGKLLAVGASFEESGTKGVNSSVNGLAPGSGAVYAFR